MLAIKTNLDVNSDIIQFLIGKQRMNQIYTPSV